MRRALAAALVALALPAQAADLSPGSWPASERARLERAELFSRPQAARTIQGRELVSATLSPVAVHVGVEALRQGGTAADAAVAVALTQIATDLGAVVSYAGVAELIYYEARTGRVHALDAGWGAYAGERDPASIPVMDVSRVTGAASAAVAGPQGRKTLAPGFMAGMAAAHRRFGRLPWADLFQPSIWYAEQGLPVTPLLGAYFGLQAKQLSRTEEGRRFLAQAGGATPKYGDRFVQPQLAALLKGVAAQGPRYMYEGPWARTYVDVVRREGGAVTLADLKGYRPIWETPQSVRYGDATVVGPGRDNLGGTAVLKALERLDAQPPPGVYWRDPAGFEAHARAVRAAIVDAFIGHHSASVVAVDRDGNVAVLVHSINSVMWGDTGIVVGGVPIAGSAGLYKQRLAGLKRGAHLASDMAPVLALRDGNPVLGVAAIGSSLVHETVRLTAGALAGGDLGALAAAPPLLMNLASPDPAEPVPAGAYDAAFKAALVARGVEVREEPADRVAALRGTAALAAIGPAGASTAETPATITFGEVAR